MNEPEHPPTLDYQTPEAETWRHGWGSLIVNAMSIALYCILGLALVIAALRRLVP